MNIGEVNDMMKNLEHDSYRAIRQKINDFQDESSNDEIAGFVKGVVELQTQLYGRLKQKSYEITR